MPCCCSRVRKIMVVVELCYDYIHLSLYKGLQRWSGTEGLNTLHLTKQTVYTLEGGLWASPWFPCPRIWWCEFGMLGQVPVTDPHRHLADEWRDLTPNNFRGVSFPPVQGLNHGSCHAVPALTICRHSAACRDTYSTSTTFQSLGFMYFSFPSDLHCSLSKRIVSLTHTTTDNSHVTFKWTIPNLFTFETFPTVKQPVKIMWCSQHLFRAQLAVSQPSNKSYYICGTSENGFEGCSGSTGCIFGGPYQQPASCIPAWNSPDLILLEHRGPHTLLRGNLVFLWASIYDEAWILSVYGLTDVTLLQHLLSIPDNFRNSLTSC